MFELVFGENCFHGDLYHLMMPGSSNSNPYCFEHKTVTMTSDKIPGARFFKWEEDGVRLVGPTENQIRNVLLPLMCLPESVILTFGRISFCHISDLGEDVLLLLGNDGAKNLDMVYLALCFSRVCCSV